MMTVKEAGKLGGTERAKRLSRERRVEIAREAGKKGAEARSLKRLMAKILGEPSDDKRLGDGSAGTSGAESNPSDREGSE